MIREGENICPICGFELRYYDRVKRITIDENRSVEYIYLKRFRCKKCKKTHRALIENILPYKHYIRDVIEYSIDKIADNIIAYEDYPCEVTIFRWAKEYKNDDI